MTGVIVHKGRLVPKSRILDAAERLRIVGSTLNNPHDVAIAQQYVDDLEELATWEVTTPNVVGRSALEEEGVAILGSILKKAFHLDLEPRFSRFLNALDDEKHRTW